MVKPNYHRSPTCYLIPNWTRPSASNYHHPHQSLRKSMSAAHVRRFHNMNFETRPVRVLCRQHFWLIISTRHFTNGQDMLPPQLQPRHDMQRIDPALFTDPQPRYSSQTSPAAQRPTVDTSYPPYPQTQSASTPYPHSAPLRSSYDEVSPRSAVSAAPVPYYPPQQYRFPRNLTTPSSQYKSPNQAEEAHRQPLSPYQSVESRQRPRGSFHPYDPQGNHRRPSHGGESPSTDSSAHAGGQRATTGRNYICPSCFKEFSRPSSLKIHEHSHSGAKPFVCPRPGCGKSFSVRSNMKRHERGCHLGQQAQVQEEAAYGQEQ